MTDIVQATVAETPRPERPDKWLVLGPEDGYPTLTEAESFVREMLSDGYYESFIVHIPGTRAAAAGDAVAELCGPKHQGFIEWNRCWNPDVHGQKRGVFAAGYNKAGELIEAYGPDSQSAARAALEAIRGGKEVG